MRKLKTKNSKHKTHRRGMAMLIVLFMIIAVVAISLGILYRADMAAAGGHNYALRTQADYIAWAGLEHARALILANPSLPDSDYNQAPFTLDEASLFYYHLTIDPNVASIDPNNAPWQYAVACEVYYQKDPSPRSRSAMTASVLYDPNALEANAWLTDIRRTPGSP